MWLPALLHSIALILSLNIHALSDTIAGTWMLFLLAGCAALLKDGYPEKTRLWYAILLWLVVIGASCFIVTPVQGGSAPMWSLAAMPLIALCMRRDNVNIYLKLFGLIIFIYAIVLLYQFIFDIHAYGHFLYDYAWFDGTHTAPAWPMINPNNAAAVMNCGLIPAFFMALRKDKHRITPIIAVIFALALIATGSKAGIAGGVMACGTLFVRERGFKWWFGGVFAIACIIAISPWAAKAIPFALDARKQVWAASAILLDVRPLRGLGMGMFHYYYAQVRTEHVTAGYWAHNDLMQIAIEMGIPAVLAFCWQWIEVLSGVTRRNLPAVCVIGAVLFQSMLEFQIYVPAISMLLGLALAWYYHNTNLEMSHDTQTVYMR